MTQSDLPDDLVPLLARLTEERLEPAELDRLAEILRSSKPARDLYRDTISIHALLYWRERHRWSDHQETIGGTTDQEAQRLDEKLERIANLPAEKFVAPRQQPDRTPRPKPYLRRWKSVCAATASVAASILLLVYWMLPGPIPVSTVPIIVASIEDSIDARWSDPALSTVSGTQLASGQNLVLTHGIVRLAMEGGAMAIVEAPATIELLSASSARLVQGKLVGLVPRSDVRLTIKTPGASITDLGTEFGVEVNPQQVTHLHVFKGRVSVATLDANGKTAQQQTVLVNKAVNLQPKTGAIEPAPVDTADRFVRRLLFSLPIYSTGVGLAEGDEDPHWQIVAAQNVADFSPQPAIVATPAPEYMPIDSQQSQWVSLSRNLPEVNPEARYTLRTTFDLRGFDLATASIGGSFSVDNQVTAIRVNGKKIAVPVHQLDEFKKVFSFSVDRKLLKAGRNQLEVDIYNGGEGVKPVATSIALRVLLEGKAEKIE